ncbi:Bacitracin export permease protein BceB [Bacillus altitudinis]|uniref:ABC transporter permease n=1 Tax=Bacillus TaxID=1386 RepID=UPI00061A1483|nr:MULTISPECIES: ABC transporter permease [Bacillus]AKC66996.1 bacitracin ABC transporter permease [Bacillus altitudinis]AKU33344.1 bacitracin ABC transporter permease [Bacillus altitudinis]MBR0631542.1 ABC transporter permease [Bacillus altitudinis C101]MCL4100210.1 Bacitracin export permease protein BceB [Bacillus altitudinis]PGD44161.1 ABC transporter permease [Bacillus altitudinis]
MNINQLVFRNLKKNLKNYYLYVFALVFSVALYFSFVTLQYSPALDDVKGSIKGGASIKAASVLLIAIVGIFLLYANSIFIKRRGREIGLLQLIGMTKQKISKLLNAENFILYVVSMAIGIIAGFIGSKLMLMVLFKVTGVNAIANLHFSGMALLQTLIVFFVIYGLIMLRNRWFINRQTILSLFRTTSSTEQRVKKISVFEIIIGVLGIAFISSGYYISSKLFTGTYTSMLALLLAMIYILASVIIGTFLFYKGSVSFIANIVRKRKNGYLAIHEVLSLSSIMFRLKSNALLLTIITTVSALAIGLLSLSYISYYSAEKTAEQQIPSHFVMGSEKEANTFTRALSDKHIAYDLKQVKVIRAKFDAKKLMDMDAELKNMNNEPGILTLPVISEKNAPNIHVGNNEVILSGYSDLLKKFMPIKSSGDVKLLIKKPLDLKVLDLKKDYLISYNFTFGGLPVAVVSQDVFEQLDQQKDPKLQLDQQKYLQFENSLYIAVNIKDKKNLEKANNVFNSLKLGENSMSQLASAQQQKQTIGLMMFIVGFLGLSFLVTSGCILYFKQMNESEEEQSSYTILRKLGFTEKDLLKGIRLKQLFNFGIPLVVGLLHSYFAVQSGWFFFGGELWTPMLIVMSIYTVLYSIFGFLSVQYYKKVIKESL